MSGGNEDTVSIGAVIQKGMITRGRIMHFEVELPDTPGHADGETAGFVEIAIFGCFSMVIAP